MERISTINEISERVDLTCRSIVIVGAHINGKRICKYLLSHNINVKCFIDEDPKKFRTNYLGIPILSPKEYVLNVVDVIIICISSFNSLSNEKILQKPIGLKAVSSRLCN